MKGKKTGGRKAGTPNKSKSEVRQLIETVCDYNKLFSNLYELALKGEVQASKILIEYGFGKPTQSVELSTPDGIEITRTIIDRQS